MRTRSVDTDVYTFTPVLEAAALADNDVFFIPIEIPLVFENSPARVLQSIVVLDGDDQAVSFELVFFNANVTLGTLNAAVSISDSDAFKALGAVLFDTAGTVDGSTGLLVTDLINSTLYTKTGIGLPLAKGADTSLWVGGIVRSGTPDYTASGMQIKLGFI